MARLVRALAAVLFAAAVPLLIVTSTVRWLATDETYMRHGFRAFDAAERTGLPQAEIDRAGAEVLAYFRNDADRLEITVTADGQQQPLFSEREIAHMADVKALIRAVFRLQEVSLVVVLAYIALAVLWSGETSPRTLAKLALAGIGAGAVLTAGIAAFALTGFDQAWTTFHEIAFRNDLWQLDPDTDRLIQMYPEPFWQQTTYLAGAIIGGACLAVAAACGAYLLRGPRERERAAA
ncbi:TIGR01906 family membrane protein [Tepidiforma sp.]|uniref:TIGR01906 family membrane protein n=1 Tax=Tepidiforma sp. TaxID=2682230 RepID=UPI002ADD836C|nr:TIGR01906 family membrane protein [Tepidiforma sp.]